MSISSRARESDTENENETGWQSRDQPVEQPTPPDRPLLTRRQFLGGVTGVAAVTAVGPGFSGAVAAQSPLVSPASSAPETPPYGDAEISREGVRTLAEHEYRQQKKGNTIQYTKTVNAVTDLGCDPNGTKPIEETIMNAAEDGLKIVFPPGEYLVTSAINVGLSGTFGFVGEGFESSKQPPKPGQNAAVFKAHADTSFSLVKFMGMMQAGQVGNFVIDGRGSHIIGGVKVGSSGNVRVRDIRVLGTNRVSGTPADDDVAPPFTPFAEGKDSLIVMERCIARGGGLPGSKNIGGTHGFGVFGRDGPRGTVILKDGVIENWADNGIYGARTGAKVHVLGGLYRNNDVSQVRVNGNASVDGVDVVVDEHHYTGLKTKSHADERGPGWPATNGIKIETAKRMAHGSWSTKTPVRNCKVVGNSVATKGGVLGGLVHVFDTGGAVTIENCHFIKTTDSGVVLTAEQPGTGNYAAAPKPWLITVKNSLIEGGAAGGPAITTRGRPRSIVKSTCFAYAGASKTDVSGPGVSGCSFGSKCRSNSGLSKPKKVGSGANISSVPINVSYSGPADSFGDGGGGNDDGLGLKGKAAVGVGIVVLPVVAILLGVAGTVGGGLFWLVRKLGGSDGE